MLPSHLHQWTVVITSLKLQAFAIENALSRLPEDVVEREYSEFFNGPARNGVALVAALCGQVALFGAQEEATRLREALNNPMKVSRLASALEHLFQRVQADTKSVALLHVPPEDVELYEQGADHFSAAARRRFRAAIEDMSEAVKCLALGRYTASVFHNMRASETAVRKLAEALEIVLGPKWTWNQIADQAAAKIKDLPVDTPVNSRRKARLASACAHAHMLRIAYRNEVMHPNTSYDRHQAVQILAGTRGFLNDLAAGL